MFSAVCWSGTRPESASAQTFFRKGGRHTQAGTKEKCGKGCCGETAGDAVMEKNCSTSGGLQPLEDPHQSRGAVRSKDQWRKVSKKQGMEEIKHYTLTSTSYAAHHCTKGTGRDGEQRGERVKLRRGRGDERCFLKCFFSNCLPSFFSPNT